MGERPEDLLREQAKEIAQKMVEGGAEDKVLSKVISPAFIERVGKATNKVIAEADSFGNREWDRKYAHRDGVIKAVFGPDILEGFDTATPRGKNDRKRRRVCKNLGSPYQGVEKVCCLRRTNTNAGCFT